MNQTSPLYPDMESLLRRHVAALLIAYRKRHRVNQALLAAQLGISQSHLSKIEASIADLSTAPFLRFCLLAQVDPSTLADSGRFETHYRSWLSQLPLQA